MRYTTTVAGFSLLSGVQSAYSGFFFVTLNPWEERKKLTESYQALKGQLNLKLIQLPEGTAFAFSPPAIPGLGVAGGVTFVLEDRADRGVQYLANNVDTFLAAARERRELARVTTTLLPNVPQVDIEVDRDKALKQGVALKDIYNTLQTFLGGSFVNYFNRFGRQWQVYVQADDAFRTNAEQIGQFYVRNTNNNPVPLSSVTRIKRRFGPEFTMRYNLYRSAQIQVLPAPGYSSGQAMRALEEVFARTMPRDMGYDYLGMSFQEKKAQQGISPVAIFGFSLLFVFLILAALYESWSLPFSVLLSTPVAVFGTLGALYLRRSAASAILPPILVQIENNVFAQIGLVMIIGLVAKNAILIVEFAKVEYENGATIAEAALSGARLRLRPILMTSLAFIAGCVPLALASGSGAVARQVLGTGVIGGMLAASGIAIFVIPAGFCIVERADGLESVTSRRQEVPGLQIQGRDRTRMSRFFVNRPIVAIVISLVTMIAGAISVTFLPVSLFPEIVTPQTVVTANYTGADARTVEQSVATPIEQQMTGVDNMNYMYSVSANSGQMVLTIDFDLNTDPNTDQILVQMRQTQASSQLPSAVNNLGVTVQKSLSAPLMVISLYSPDGSRDALFLSNYAYINLNDALTRVRGISNVQISGAGEYAMRLWLKPDQLANLSLSVPDIVNAVQAQNTVNSAGQIGSEPVPNGQEYTYTARAQGRLTTPEEFGEIIVRQQSDGGTVRLKDVARAELGAQIVQHAGDV